MKALSLMCIMTKSLLRASANFMLISITTEKNSRVP